MSWPAPEVAARLAEAAEIPRGAATVQKVALAAGWSVTPTYARGTTPAPRTGQPGGVVESLALRMRRGAQRAVAVWVDGAFDLAIVFGDQPHRLCNATQLRKELA